jgi:kynurenine formamidase
LIIDTGWGSRWDEPGYVTDAPAFAASTLEWFQAQPFSILVLDTPVMECLWCATEGLAAEQGDLLAPLYRDGMLLIAPVVNLDQIESQIGTLISMSLPVEGVSSAPCRAAFVEGVDWTSELSNG